MKQVSEKKSLHPIRGLLLPMNGNKPVFMQVAGQTLLPVFSDKTKFSEASKWGKFEEASSSVIVNPQEFYDCVMFFKKRFPFHVVLDPYITDEGNTRFQLLMYGEENGKS